VIQRRQSVVYFAVSPAQDHLMSVVALSGFNGALLSFGISHEQR